MVFHEISKTMENQPFYHTYTLLSIQGYASFNEIEIQFCWFFYTLVLPWLQIWFETNFSDKDGEKYN